MPIGAVRGVLPFAVSGQSSSNLPTVRSGESRFVLPSRIWRLAQTVSQMGRTRLSTA
jgi:hypothetical protein